MIENILVIDVETTGLDATRHKCIEVAAVLFNVPHRAILQQFSTLFPCDENPVEDINGIKPAATQATFSCHYWDVHFMTMVHSAQAIIAHNAQFDKKFIDEFKLNISVPWICTKNDFAWPVNLPRKRLQDVCEAMGIAYDRAHRALTDCMFIVDCFNKVEDLESRLENALSKVSK